MAVSSPVQPLRSQRRQLFFLIWLLLLATLASRPSAVAAQPSAPRQPFVVVKVQNRTGQPAWENHLIAYGIRTIVNDELYRSGRYIPIEDDPEMRDQIDRFIAADWQATTASAPPAISCDTQVRVYIERFTTSRLRSIGLFAAAKTTLQVDVSIEIAQQGQPLQRLTGSGKGVTKSLGILFEIRQDKVHFNETSVGQATQKAIEDAIAKL